MKRETLHLLKRFVAFGLCALGTISCEPDVGTPKSNTEGTLVAQYDPTAMPPVLPLPNDLVKQGGDGVHLNVPNGASDSDAQIAFNAYLNTLDGFPTASTASVSFSGAIDMATVNAKSVMVLDLGTGMPLAAADYTAALDSTKQVVIITPTKRWQTGDSYAVLVFGGADANGIKGANGETVLASQFTYFTRSASPVVGECADGTTACQCDIVNDPADCHALFPGITDAQGLQLEQVREGLAPLLATGLGTRSRSDLVAVWTFGITTQPEAIFDPTRSDVPFPNDVLINQQTGLVNVPFDPNDPEASIKAGLNTLDGFSTTAPETVTIDFLDDIDGATLVPNQSAFLIDPPPGGDPTQFVAVPVAYSGVFAGQIAIQPTLALIPDQHRYLVVLTTDVKDKSGRPLTPSPAFQLLKSTSPLFDGTASTVSVLDNASAQQLEGLRVGYQPVFGAVQQLAGISPDKIASMWSFTTESIMRPLKAVQAYPTTANLSTSVTIDASYNAAFLSAANTAAIPTTGGLLFRHGNIQKLVVGTLHSQDTIDHTAGAMSFTRTSAMTGNPSDDTFALKPASTAPAVPIKFVLTVPNGASAGSPAPVVILQHGFTQWRGGMLPLADAFAAQGLATISIDGYLHGERSACTADSDCDSSGTCTNGICSTKLKHSATDCALAQVTGNPDDCNTVASGLAFVNPENLFNSRDNGRQFIMDLVQVGRIVEADISVATNLGNQVPEIDHRFSLNGGFLGHSLGGIMGGVYLAITPEPPTGVLTAAGGHDFEELADGEFHPVIAPLLAALGIQTGTAQYAQLLATARWALDPVDPFAVGRFVVQDAGRVVPYTTQTANVAKHVILQEMGADMVVPDQYQEALATQLFGSAGLDSSGHAQGASTSGVIVSTYFAGATHSDVALPVPLEATDSQSIRSQAARFIKTQGAQILAP